MEFHPAADLFPLIEGQAFQDLIQDIDKHGQREPIIIHNDGSILDGRNRYRACLELGIEPDTKMWMGVYGEEVDFVLSLNLHRRHLNESQRAMVAAKIANMRGDSFRGNQHVDSTNSDEAITAADAAEKLNVGRSAVFNAKKVQENATPDLIKKVEGGTVSVSAAADVATLPKEEQAEIVARGEKAILEAAKTIRADKSREKKQARINDINQQALDIAGFTPTAPSGLYHVISIDPPWPYGTNYDPEGRRAANPYPEMTLDEIAAIELPSEEHCVLWLWTTHKFMKHAFGILDEWGFEDKMILTWVKDGIGLGTWLRSQSEFCIMATKGKPPVTLTNQSTVVKGPLREHSRKPDEFFDMVSTLCHGRKLEYFSREPRDGWEQLGNEKEKF